MKNIGRAVKAALVCVALSGCAAGASNPSWVASTYSGHKIQTLPDGIRVHNDPGGHVTTRINEIRELNARGDRVEIVGTCASACTLYLGADNVCISPNAMLGFHGPRSGKPGGKLTLIQFERASARMASMYPDWIKAWFMEEARYVQYKAMWLSGDSLIRSGYASC